MIDNFEQIETLLSFDDPDLFYHLQIIRRGKDHPDEESYDNVSDYQEALDWWESSREEITVDVELVTEDLIEKLGEDYYLWDKSEPDYDLTK